MIPRIIILQTTSEVSNPDSPFVTKIHDGLIGTPRLRAYVEKNLFHKLNAISDNVKSLQLENMISTMV